MEKNGYLDDGDYSARRFGVFPLRDARHVFWSRTAGRRTTGTNFEENDVQCFQKLFARTRNYSGSAIFLSGLTVMLVGLVNSGLMEIGQTIGVIMGSNIGTTLTSWLLSLSGIKAEIQLLIY